jgi:hypothetical protein
MGKLITKRRRSKIYQVGDLRDRIKILGKRILPPDHDSAVMKHVYSIYDRVWCAVETITGNKLFDNFVNLQEKTTHMFIIRYQQKFDSNINPESGLTFEHRIEFIDSAYEILTIDNPEFRNRFLFIQSKWLGEDNLRAND